MTKKHKPVKAPRFLTRDAAGNTRLTTGGRAGVVGAITAAGLLALSQVGGYEGLRLYVYKDVIGVYTYCYGETKDAKKHIGQRFTPDQCKVIFLGSLTEHEKRMRACLDNPDDLSDKTYVAFLSLSYNIGEGAFCRSSVARDINNGHVARACHDLLKFTKAGGHTVAGLVRRRRQEEKLCLAGL